MRSKWFKYKEKAVHLRKKGLSIRTIEFRLGMPRSTLSGWFKNIELTKAQQELLRKKWIEGLSRARNKAVEWHRAEKEKRLRIAQREARSVVNNIKINDSATLELALSILYLGEGTKGGYDVRMSNSNPIILKTFITLLNLVYGIEFGKIKCGLNLRADQNSAAMKKFWSKFLCVPARNFTYIIMDKRTVIEKTYPHYKGVCMVRCGNTALKRRVMEVGNEFCKKILSA